MFSSPAQLSRGQHSEAGEKNGPQDNSDSELKTTALPVNRNLIWIDVKNMDSVGLSDIEVLLESAEECAVTLIMADQSSQLRDQKVR